MDSVINADIETDDETDENNLIVNNKNFNNYDIKPKLIEELEIKYGGHLRCKYAARKIQLAYRQYNLKKNYLKICENSMKRRSMDIEKLTCLNINNNENFGKKLSLSSSSSSSSNDEPSSLDVNNKLLTPSTTSVSSSSSSSSPPPPLLIQQVQSQDAHLHALEEALLKPINKIDVPSVNFEKSITSYFMLNESNNLNLIDNVDSIDTNCNNNNNLYATSSSSTSSSLSLAITPSSTRTPSTSAANIELHLASPIYNELSTQFENVIINVENDGSLKLQQQTLDSMPITFINQQEQEQQLLEPDKLNILRATPSNSCSSVHSVNSNSTSSSTNSSSLSASTSGSSVLSTTINNSSTIKSVSKNTSPSTSIITQSKSTSITATSTNLSTSPSSSKTLTSRVANISATSSFNYERKLLIGTTLFNHKPERGIRYLIENKYIDATPRSIAKFLLNNKLLSKQMINEYISNKKDESAALVLE